MRRREGWNEWKRRELIGRRKQTEREKEDVCFLLALLLYDCQQMEGRRRRSCTGRGREGRREGRRGVDDVVVVE